MSDGVLCPHKMHPLQCQVCTRNFPQVGYSNVPYNVVMYSPVPVPGSLPPGTNPNSVLSSNVSLNYMSNGYHPQHGTMTQPQGTMVQPQGTMMAQPQGTMMAPQGYMVMNVPTGRGGPVHTGNHPPGLIATNSAYSSSSPSIHRPLSVKGDTDKPVAVSHARSVPTVKKEEIEPTDSLIILPGDKRFPPPFRKFKWLFFDHKNQLYDLQTNHKLNKAKERFQQFAKVTINGKKLIFDFHVKKRKKESDPPEKAKNFEFKPRVELWYFKDRDGIIRPYEEHTIAEITKELHSVKPRPVINVHIGKHVYDIDLVSKVQRNITTSTERKIYSEGDLEKMRKWEIDFKNVPPPVPPKNASVVKLDPKTLEYHNISEYFHIHMPREVKQKGILTKWKETNKITKIEKIYNPSLRAHWEFFKEKLREKNHYEPNIQYSRLLWHGSGFLDPAIIYEDNESGWKTTYAGAKNLWGPGLYFGEDASYCHKYTYVPSEGKHQVFLAEVLTGDDIISLEDANIREPGQKEEDGVSHYDSVCGVRHEVSWIWIVYTNGRAYPTYLVEYED